MAKIDYEKYFPKNFSKLPSGYSFKYLADDGKYYSRPKKGFDTLAAFKKSESEPKSYPYYIATNYGDFTEIMVGTPYGHTGFKTRDKFPEKVKEHIICQLWGDKMYETVGNKYGPIEGGNAARYFLNVCYSKFNLSNPI